MWSREYASECERDRFRMTLGSESFSGCEHSDPRLALDGGHVGTIARRPRVMVAQVRLRGAWL
jgi:hypothetical protein